MSDQMLSVLYKRLHLFGLLLIVYTGFASAGLPIAVNNQPLPSLAPVLESVTPAVVNIYSTTREQVRNPLLEDPFLRHFFDLPSIPQERVSQSLGSGVIIDSKNGIVLTNHHVVEGADNIRVTLSDGRSFSADRIGSDAQSDVAVLKIEADHLTALKLADSNALRVGDFVVAVGNPFGLGQTVTSGIVSALGRSGLRGLGVQNFIQTDASINPGNSGGALINLRGELVGLNTAIFSPSGGNVGIGFAIPSRLLGTLSDQIQQFGEVRRGTLGVSLEALDAALSQSLNIDYGRGVLIESVDINSPAEQAGIQPGDIILSINDQSVNSIAAFRLAESLLPLNLKQTIYLSRRGKNHSLQVSIPEASPLSLDGSRLNRRFKGVLLTVDQPGRHSKVIIEKMTRGSPLYRSGLRPGDQILEINAYPIRDLDQLVRLFQTRLNLKEMSIMRQGQIYKLAL